MSTSFHVFVGAAVVLLLQAIIGTLPRSGSAFERDRAARVSSLWALNLGLMLMLFGVLLGYWAGLRANPMNCDDVANLTTSVQALNEETAAASHAVADFTTIMDRRFFPLAEEICAQAKRHHATPC